MAKYFEVDFRKGSFQDQTGRRTVTITGSPEIKRGDKGIYTITNSSSYLIYNSQIIPDNAFTVVLAIKTPINNNAPYIFSTNTLGTPFFSTNYFGNGYALLELGSNNTKRFLLPSNFGKDFNWNLFILTVPGNAQTDISNAKLYLNGNTLTDSTVNITGIQSSRTTITNCLRTHTVYTSAINTTYFAVYDHVFTEAERAKAYQDFLNSYPVVQEKLPQQSIINKPMDLSREKDNTITRLDDNLQCTKYSNNIVTTVDGVTTITYVDSQYGAQTNTFNDAGALNKNLVVGNKIKVRFKVKGSSVTTLTFRIYDIGGNTDISFIPTLNYTDYEVTHVVKSELRYIHFANFAIGSSIEIKDVVVEELTGLVAAYNMIPQGNTLVDISGEGYNGVITGTTSAKKGLQFNGISDKIVLSSLSSYISINNNFSVSVRFIIKGTSPQQQTIFNCTKSFSDLFGIAVDASLGIVKAGIYNGSSYLYKAHGNILLNKEVTVTVTFNISTLLMYVNGILVTGTTYSPSLSTVVGTNLGINNSNDYPLNGEIHDFRVYNRVLTEQEAKVYHNQFVTPSLQEDFSSEGADGIAKVPSGWVKQSGSFKIDEFSINSGELVRNGGFDSSTGWILAATATISDGLLNINTPSSAWTIAAQTASNVKLGGVYLVKFTVLNYIGGEIVVGVSGSSTVGGFYASGNGDKIGYIYKKDGTNNIVFNAPTYFIGSIDNLSIVEVSPLPTFKPGTKYLECVTAGVLAIPSKQAYGTWEFYLYKAGDSNNIDILFAHSKIGTSESGGTGWVFRFTSGEAFKLLRVQVGGDYAPFNTVDSYAFLNTWYRIKITKTLSGIHTMLAKGGSLTPTAGYDGWTLVSTTGGTGTNPYTDTLYAISEYLVLDIDAGDRIANIKMLDGIKQ